ncbi:ATP-grasp domain-containing protein [Neobacillus sp. YIM B06451]|uniref:ATP-grasp domain-containing protein n=1 Tax=Neobacillus sp. YIM B06451 TaxID=3070994 RepID=UPI00293165D1|nr:ATP-grasp domain-containing protein [Neobacillus sp. YIM B06451]
MKIEPSMTLQDIFGPELVFNPRVSFQGLGWVPSNENMDDFRTGALLPIAGDMPLVCNRRTVTDETLGLFEKAGITPASNLLVYDSEESFYSLVDELNSRPLKKVMNHPVPESEVPEGNYWIDKNVFSYLNNKANLGELVPLEHRPKRFVATPSEASSIKEEWGLPFVMKAGTDLPNGGGHDVFFCYTDEDFAEALESLEDSESIVIEEIVDIRKNYCIQFAKTHDGKIIYLGAGEQITTDSGEYKGNWISNAEGPPDEAIALGKSIMEKACELGYKGVAGFDILLSEEGRVLCIDLNFRLNGSTPALLLKDSIFESYQTQDMMYKTWKIDSEWNDFLSVCKNMIESRTLIPLAIYHPDVEGNPGTQPFINGILIGDSRDDILKKEQYLAECGWN